MIVGATIPTGTPHAGVSTATMTFLDLSQEGRILINAAKELAVHAEDDCCGINYCSDEGRDFRAAVFENTISHR